MNKWLAGIVAVFLFNSIAGAAPHIFKSKPEPIEHVGTAYRERMARKSAAAMLAPAVYPASVNILFLRVEFQQEQDPSTAKTTGDGLWSDPSYSYNNDPDYWVNRAKTNFINYWNEVSLGKLVISIETSTAIYKLPYVMKHYGNESNAALENLIYDSVMAAQDIDFSLYDAILIVHAGAGEESDTKGDTPNDIWSLYYNNANICQNSDPSPPSQCLPDQLKLRNGKAITEAIMMPQTDSQDGYTIDPLGVYVHEFGHWLGLPDLYCTGLVCLLDGVGKWSLMGDGIYNADPSSQADQASASTCATVKSQCIYGSSPAHLDAWSKVFLGWVTPATTVPPEDQGSHVFNPVEYDPDIVKIQASTATSSQYFLLENRQQTGYDKGLPGHGLLVWLVDDVIINNNLSSNTVNNNRFRPGLKLIEADNDWNLLSYGCTAPDDCGSSGDPYPGSTNNATLTPHSVPPSLPYTPSAWVNIKNITEAGPSPDTATVSAVIRFTPHAPSTPGMYSNVVSWPSNTDQDIDVYNVYKNGVFLASSATTSYADITAQVGDVYQITAVDAIGDESDFSGQVIANIQVVGSEGNANPRCFIATAAYGSSLDPHVEALRKFRDRFLLTNGAGRVFVSAYYRYSPPVADLISRHESLRTVVRWMLSPIVYGAEYPAVLLLLFLTTGVVLAAGRRMRTP